MSIKWRVMDRRSFLGTLSAASLHGQAQTTKKKPNIIVIMADDMGYSDLGCYGGEIETPNLNRMAAEGVRFREFKNTARCCPTRASLLTGLYSHQAGIGHMVNDYGVPGYRGDLNRTSVTIGEALKPAGYATAMIGKWHVTPADMKKQHNWPVKRGFDYSYSTIVGAGNFFNPHWLVRNGERIEPEGDYYYTDALSAEAVKYIEGRKDAAQPFFMYLAYTAPHWPMHAREKDIAKYKGKYAKGWDKLRAERHERMLKVGSVEKKWEIAPRDPKTPAWEETPNKDWQQRRMEVYAAMVDALDQGIGRVLEALKRTGADENTLVLFLADNGGCAEGMGNRAQGLYTTKTLDGKEVVWGNRPELMPGPGTTFQSYGPEWAHLSNTPFRLYKHWVHEGGISSPLIARWPAQMKQKGGWTNQVGHVIDLMATCLDAAGAEYPKTHAGEQITPLEGKSLLGAMRNPKQVSPRTLYWEHEGNRAVRDGDWKLVAQHKGEWELYNVREDRTEMKDLAAKDPGRAARMKAQYEAWAKRANVVAWDELKRS